MDTSKMTKEELAEHFREYVQGALSKYIGKPISMTSEEVRNRIQECLRYAPYEEGENRIDEKSSHAIAQVLAMQWITAKKVEDRPDPKELVKDISDEYLAQSCRWFQGDTGGIATILLAEHYKRTGRIVDWQWTWAGPNEGNMSLKLKEPLSFTKVTVEVNG